MHGKADHFLGSFFRNGKSLSGRNVGSVNRLLMDALGVVNGHRHPFLLSPCLKCIPLPHPKGVLGIDMGVAFQGCRRRTHLIQ